MIVIDQVELSKHSVSINEVFIIKITVREVMANWDDVKQRNWQNLRTKTWDKVKRKII